jgi:hypothetical protein
MSFLSTEYFFVLAHGIRSPSVPPAAQWETSMAVLRERTPLRIEWQVREKNSSNRDISKQAPQKPHDFNRREHKPECFKEEFIEWREDAPGLVQRADGNR